jgi:hypothetical protein
LCHAARQAFETVRALESYGDEKCKTNRHRNGELDRAAIDALTTLLGSSEAAMDAKRNRDFFRRKAMLVSKPGTVVLFDGGCVHEAASGEQDAASAAPQQDGGRLMRALHWLTPGAFCMVDDAQHKMRAQGTQGVHPDMRAFLCEDNDKTTAEPAHVHAWARGLHMKEYEKWKSRGDQAHKKRKNEATPKSSGKKPNR